ncbi:MAG: phosphoribosylanthranilate isomerase, partial [Bacteroidetes bacterium]|nr:phosphoribosylanthranilate isomerase [Bacteroidota bacterium]
EYCRLNYAQLHGTESPKYCERLARFASPCQVIKALRVGPGLTAEMVQPYIPHVKGFLLDTYKKNTVGGTGEIFDWSLINQLYLQKPFLLAGGLDEKNITAALERVKPYGVDANSGLEIKPGIKDPELIKTFIAKVRKFEAASLAS